MDSRENDMKKIGLALSGGGTRAMAFHCGVIRWLADTECLEQVTHISSVSGGSLLTGLILRLSSWKWPSSGHYKVEVLPRVRKSLTEQDLAYQATVRLFNPSNWKYLLSRANILAQTIEANWDINVQLTNLPVQPVWSINGTTAETGRRFRFKKTAVGDYELGYADAVNFKVAEAMAVSAAFPGLIGPFAIKTTDFTWHKRESWGASLESAERKQPPFKHLHLYDGGVYDNLGTEPLFDSGKQKPKDDTDFILVSDAGAPLPRGNLGFSLNPFRMKRIADIMSDQARALRVRSFVSFLQNNPQGGAYIQIGTSAREKLEAYKQNNPLLVSALLMEDWLTSSEATRAANYSTNLSKMNERDFDLLEQHGYETARWNHELFLNLPTTSSNSKA